MCTAPPSVPERSSVTDVVAKLINFFSQECKNFCYSLFLLANKYAEQYGFADIINLASDKVAEHPILGFGLLGCAVGCAIPVLFFILFALVSTVFAFVGFLLLECVILTFAGICLIPFFFGGVLLMTLVATVITILYFIALNTGLLLSDSSSRSSFLRFAQQEPQQATE